MQLDLFIHQEKPWPEQIIDSLNGHMTILETPDGRRYCVRDWVYEVSGSTSKQRHTPLANLKRQFPEIWKVVQNVHALPNPDAGNQPMEFTDEAGLYEITIRMDDKSEAVRNVKTMLAKSAVFVDWARRNPDKASAYFAGVKTAKRKSAEYFALRREGFSEIEAEQRIRERDKLTEIFKDVAATWQQHGANGWDYATLRNIWSAVLKGKTATEIKREMGISETPWNYDSAMDLVLNQILAIIARGFHDQRESFGVDELGRDIRDTKPTIDAVRGTLADQFSNRARQPRIKPPDQLKLEDGRR